MVSINSVLRASIALSLKEKKRVNLKKMMYNFIIFTDFFVMCLLRSFEQMES